MYKLSKGLNKISTGWVTLTALLVFLIFMATVLPRQAEKAARNSGGSPSPDTSFYYSVDELYAMAGAYGQSGRQAYIQARFTFDLIFPLVYTLFLTTAISWCTQRIFHRDSKWVLTNLVPVSGMIFDFLENSAASLIMARYPAKTQVIDVFAPVFTLLKWIFVYGSFALLLAGILLVFREWLGNTTRRNTK